MARKKPTKPVTKTASKTTAAKPRRLQERSYKSLRLQKRIKPPVTASMPPAWRIFQTSLQLIYKNWKLFGSIIAVYGILNVLLVNGLSGGLNLGGLQGDLKSLVGGNVRNLNSSFVVFGYLLGNASTTVSDVASVYQTFLVLYISLVTIWALRHVGTKQEPRAKQALYDGIRPLVPFMGVLAVIFLQLIPFYVGNYIFLAVINGGFAITGPEIFVWGLLFGALTLLSLYMISSSVFALYIVTLPGLKPMQALRSARNLVLYRRFEILRKVLFLPLILMLAAAIIFIPLIIFATSIVEPLFFLASMASLIIIHSYMYGVYKELLKR